MLQVIVTILTESVLKLSLIFRSCYNVFNFKFKFFILNFTEYTSFYSCLFQKAGQPGYLVIFSFNGLIELPY